MNEVIERAALAVMGVHRGWSGNQPIDFVVEQGTEAIAIARSVIAAIRDVPIETIRAGYKASPNTLNLKLGSTWRAMIDQILSEKAE